MGNFILMGVLLYCQLCDLTPIVEIQMGPTYFMADLVINTQQLVIISPGRSGPAVVTAEPENIIPPLTHKEIASVMNIQ